MRLTLRGTDVDPVEYAKELSHVPDTCRRRGEFTPSGQKILHSFISFKREFGDHDIWDDAIAEFIEQLGGLSFLRRIIEDLQPGEVTLTIAVPVRASEEQEDRYLSVETMEILTGHKIGLAFWFI